MRPFGWMGTLIIVGALGSIVFHSLGRIDGFPDELTLVFWPAEFLWLQLQTAVSKGAIKTVVSNIAVLGLLGGVQGGIVGILLDLFFDRRRAAIRRRLTYLSYSKDPVDLAFRRSVLEIICKYDPAGLLTITTDEEVYRPEAELLLANLKHLDSATGLQKFCQRKFRSHFSRDTVRDFKDYKALAEDIWTAYKKLRSSPRQIPPATMGL